jgi:hypothetical protein
LAHDVTHPNAYAAQVFAGLPSDVLASLSVEQRAAISRAVKDVNPLLRDYHVDIRVGLPLPARRYHLALLLGPENRRTARRAIDRRKHPLATVGNAVCAAGLLAIAGLLVFAGTLL